MLNLLTNRGDHWTEITHITHSKVSTLSEKVTSIAIVSLADTIIQEIKHSPISALSRWAKKKVCQLFDMVILGRIEDSRSDLRTHVLHHLVITISNSSCIGLFPLIPTEKKRGICRTQCFFNAFFRT